VPEPSFEVQVDRAVQARHPDYVALVLVASGLVNGPSDAASDTRLAAAEAHLRASGLERATDHPHIAAWRAAFSAFGAKPSRYPSSAEALIARVLKGEPLPRINALVDLYNAVSVRYVVPLGGEDADRLEGPLRLTITVGGEPFDPRGDGVDVERVGGGEVVWRDDRGVTCRRWNWRQGRRTQLTAESTGAFFVFDRLDGLAMDDLHRAADELSDLLLERWPHCTLDRIERCAG
jgi:DNA/RNA-binding domain of Phe-tRNA-synthetase-like protein